MSVSLTPEFEAFVDELVRSGRYTSASQVVPEVMLVELHRASPSSNRG